MSEWWTYTVADFLMFSSRTWYRLVEVYNAAFWPLHVATLLLGFGIVIAVLRQPAWQGRAIAGLLALLWTWVAVAFLRGSCAAFRHRPRRAAARRPAGLILLAVHTE